MSEAKMCEAKVITCKAMVQWERGGDLREETIQVRSMFIHAVLKPVLRFNPLVVVKCE
jgi:hypothetical protein